MDAASPSTICTSYSVNTSSSMRVSCRKVEARDWDFGLRRVSILEDLFLLDRYNINILFLDYYYIYINLIKEENVFYFISILAVKREYGNLQ